MTSTDDKTTGAPNSTEGADPRFLVSGDEAGTAPGDRPFRPDVEGLRAVAVMAVVLFHSGLSAVPGGYIGVDVFFVISGFVITGVLLRERSTTNGTSLLAFYGRRCRRIIPAATLVIVVTVLLAYEFGGFGIGSEAATDGRWAAVFLSNFHFASNGTNYLASQQAPSPLQNFWSLSVEEQFYLVYPMLFLILAGMRGLSLRTRLALGLVVVVGASFAFSVLDTAHDPTGAYFSPFTRAWELGLGALVAVGTPALLRVPARLGAVASWAGLGCIVISAIAFDARTAYPGSAVAIPVVGAALVIAGGMPAHPMGAELVLGRAPFRGLGRISYSLYLWHWPILIVAADAAGTRSLPVLDNLGWILVAVVVAIASYLLVENPIRHARVLRRVRWASVGTGVVVSTLCIGAVTLAAPVASAGAPLQLTRPGSGTPPATAAAVQRAVDEARSIMKVPADVTPTVAEAPNDWGGLPADAVGCEAHLAVTSVPACVFGDVHGTHTMVLDGDSHATMWFEAFNAIAKQAGWRLVLLAKDWCHVGLIPRTNPPGFGRPGGRFTQCDTWQRFATARINALDPDLLVVTQMPGGGVYPSGKLTPARWEHGLEAALAEITAPKTRKVVLGNIPITPHIDPNCLARHTDAVQQCSAVPGAYYRSMSAAEKAGAAASGASYIDVTPWFCSTTCTDIIDGIVVYKDSDHLTATYSRYLETVLSEALGFGPVS